MFDITAIINKIQENNNTQNPTDSNKNDKKTENKKSDKIHTNFILPINYLEKTQVFPLSSIVSNDLELVTSPTKSIYEYLFRPKHDFAKQMIPDWNSQYTTNIEYLNDTKEVLMNMQPYKNKISTNKFCLNCEKIQEIWKETKNNPDFLSKYSYIEWDMIKHLNESPAFLQALSFIQLMSPILSLSIPFLFLLLPFIILKIQMVPITFESYFNILKSIAKNHFIGKTLLNMTTVSPDKVLYTLFTFALYLLQIYQNVVQCRRFYTQVKYINESLCEMRDYIKYSIESMSNFIELNHKMNTYKPFMEDIKKHCEKLKVFYNELMNVKPFESSITKISEFGYLLRCFYKLHSNSEYEEAIRYSIGFEGYINNLLGVFENLNEKVVSFSEFDTNSDCKIKQQYYPPLLNDSPIKNDCSFKKNMIISSPNAGGKTTMIKSTTINIIFTQQLGCGFYESCVLNPYTHIHSYLNIPDTSGRDSLFQAESRRCKEIIDIINENNDKKYRHFCIFDELYSGTNPVEATKSAYAFLIYLSKFDNVNFILTTHYVAICKKMRKSERIQNYKMDVENLPEGGLKYTYKMRKGISKIQGAVKILQQLNYPQEIIETIQNYKK
jgi:hypothetical protein